jgi:hypothetical protein
VNQNCAVIILGGTGQVGGAAVPELLATQEYREVVMITTVRIKKICQAQKLPETAFTENRGHYRVLPFLLRL